jgi:geranylgeranyl pyrophosphate synthase
MKTIKQKLMQGDAVAEGHDQARQLAHLAVSYLDVLPASPAKDGLIDLAHLVVDRRQ